MVKIIYYMQYTVIHSLADTVIYQATTVEPLQTGLYLDQTECAIFRGFWIRKVLSRFTVCHSAKIIKTVKPFLQLVQNN